MSYINYLMNSLSMGQVIPQSYQVTALLERQNHIKMLAIALKNSILGYQHKQAASPEAQQPIARPESNKKIEKKEKQENIIEISSDEQEQTIRKQLKIKCDTNSKEGLTATPIPKKSQELSPTSEEIQQDDPIPIKPLGKTKPIKKQKPEKKEVFFHVEVPEIDALETCRLPPFGLKKCQLEGRTTFLLRRRVVEWIETGKKQKREARMLDQ